MIFPYSPPTVTRFPVKGIVTLCGSNRFSRTFDYIAQELNTNLWIALRPSFYKNAQQYHNNPEIKERLDIIHLAKIDIAEAIIVINRHFPIPDIDSDIGYIGESTLNEIKHARQRNRRIIWLEWQPENGLTQLKDFSYREFNERYNTR